MAVDSSLWRERESMRIALANATGALGDGDPIDLAALPRLERMTLALVVTSLLGLIHHVAQTVGPEPFRKTITALALLVESSAPEARKP